jgi:hypothetical protein
MVEHPSFAKRRCIASLGKPPVQRRPVIGHDFEMPISMRIDRADGLAVGDECRMSDANQGDQPQRVAQRVASHKGSSASLGLRRICPVRSLSASDIGQLSNVGKPSFVH